MDIDGVIANLTKCVTIEGNGHNLTNETIYGIFADPSVEAVKIKVDKMIDIMDESPLHQEPNGLIYIYYYYNKNIDDIITNIKFNYRYSIVLENTAKLINIPFVPVFLKKLLTSYPMLEYYFSRPTEIVENSIPITLPILFMINTKVQFKIYFDSVQEYSESVIKMTYDSYTLSNKMIKKLGADLKNNKDMKYHVSNNRGMVFEDGILTHDYDLD